MSALTESFPIPVSEFQKFLPHRAPAVWIDEVASVDASSGTCHVKYSARATYAKNNSLLESAYLEWMAQAFGFVSAAQHRLQLIKSDGDLKEAFLAAVRNYELHEVPSDLVEGDVFAVSVRATHQVGPVTLIDGQVRLRDRLLATASLKLFAVPGK